MPICSVVGCSTRAKADGEEKQKSSQATKPFIRILLVTFPGKGRVEFTFIFLVSIRLWSTFYYKILRFQFLRQT